MKKILFTLVMMLNILSINAKIVLIEPNEGNRVIGMTEEIYLSKKNVFYLNCDTLNNYYFTFTKWLGNYETNIQHYCNTVINKHVYIKLDNDSIITLTCHNYYKSIRENSAMTK